MQWITVATPPLESIEQFDLVARMNGVAEGIRARYAGIGADGKLRVVTVWESKAHADRFFAEVLGAALARALGPEPLGDPEVVGIDVARHYLRQPVG
jgi:hypothetical protein